MSPASDRLRALAVSSSAWVRDRLEAAGPWGRIRAAAVAVWALVSLAALGLALADPDANALDARVSLHSTGLGPVVVVNHGGEAPWPSLTLRLEPGGWVAHQPTVRPGEQVVVGLHRFARTGPDGAVEHPQEGWRPTRVVLRTPDEAVEVTLP